MKLLQTGKYMQCPAQHTRKTDEDPPQHRQSINDGGTWIADNDDDEDDDVKDNSVLP